jgi:hypothetical protein
MLPETIKDLQRKLEVIDEVMIHPIINNRLNLGSSVEEVNWDLIPERLVACFKPEFEYRPEEITGLYISSEESVALDGERSLKITLERNGEWWSYVSAGAIVRNDFHGGTTFARCSAEHDQPKLAREAMKALKDFMCEEESLTMNDINELEFCNEMLKFATTELERQFGGNS